MMFSVNDKLRAANNNILNACEKHLTSFIIKYIFFMVGIIGHSTPE